MRSTLFILWSGVLLAATPAIRDIDGVSVRPFETTRAAGLVFFVCTDCPISNGYAPEIRNVCAEYRSKRVTCTLIYEDVEVDPAAVKRHMAEYGYANVRAAIDRDRSIAKPARATVTPAALLIDAKGTIRYRGRIDNKYAALGKPRQQVTVHDLRDALDAVLSGAPVANPETKAFGCFIVDPELLRK
jgi:hypothetical protein